MLRKITKWVIDTTGLDLAWGSADRRVLERQILPWLAGQPELKRVLFVGCEWYTYGYRKWFPAETYWTLDYDPRKKPFGSATLHLVDSMTRLSRHFAPDSLDLVICNGVFGWGLNDPQDVEAAFSAVNQALRPGGLFLLGWNDVPKRRPVALERVAALRGFSPATLGSLDVSQYLTPGRNRHTYNLYAKR